MKRLISVAAVAAVVAVGAQAFRQNQSRLLLSTGEKNSLRDAPNSNNPGVFAGEPLDPMALGQQTRKTLAEAKYSSDCVQAEYEKENSRAYKQGKWSFFVGTVEQNGTSSLICLNDKQRIFVPGLLVEGGIREEIINGNSFVVLDVVSANSFVHPDSLKNGQMAVESIPREYSPRTSFYINSSQLKSDNINKVIERNGGYYPNPEQLASFSVVHDTYDIPGKKLGLSFYIREFANDSKTAVKAVDSALSGIGRGSLLYELYQKLANKEKIQSYILAEIEKLRGKQIPDHYRISLSLYEDKERLEMGKPVLMIEPLPNFERNSLVYCPRGGMHFETTAEHEAGTLHK